MQGCDLRRSRVRWPQAVPVEVFSGLYAESLEHVGDCVRRRMICTEIELCNGRPTGVLSRADLVPCDGDENVGGVRAGRGGRGDLVAADADGDVAERAQGPDDLADAVAGGLLQVA